MSKNIVWTYKGTFSREGFGLYSPSASGRVSAPNITGAMEMAVEEVRRSGTGHIFGIQVEVYVSTEERAETLRLRKMG